MGIIVKQTIKGSIWSYVGVIIGFVTTTYLYTEYLTPDIVGLFGILIAYSNLTGRLAGLGFQGVTTRLFSYFRDKEKGHNGFLFIALVFHIIGFSLFLLLYFIFSPSLVDLNMDKSPLFASYIYLLIPFTLANLIFLFLDTFNKVLYDAVFGVFLQEFLQRILIFSITLMFVFQLITIHQLILGYAAVVSLKALIILVHLWRKGEINLKPDFSIVDSKMKKEILNYALFSLIGGFGSMIVFNIDKIFVNHLLGLENTGVYTIAFYFGALVALPSRSLLKISGTLIADAFKEFDINKIKEIYYKSSINQLIIGGFLFIGIWSNIDNILIIVGEDYLASKWVIFFIGLGYLIDMSTGANGIIINFSKYYWVSLLFTAILIVVVVALMYFFIPIWGITGAAIAIAASLLLNNLMRYLFLFWKFRMQPFNWRFIAAIAFYIAVYFLISLISQQKLVLDIILRGAIITISSLLFFGLFPISEDSQKIVKKLMSKIKL